MIGRFRARSVALYQPRANVFSVHSCVSVSGRITIYKKWTTKLYSELCPANAAYLPLNVKSALLLILSTLLIRPNFSHALRPIGLSLPFRSFQPWVSDVVDYLNTIAKERMTELSSIMYKMGMDEKSKVEWITTIKEQAVEMYDGIINEALTIQTKLVNSIEDLLKKSSELCKLLQIPMPQYGSEDLNLYEEKEMLRKKVEKLETAVTARQQELNALKTRELEACKNLDRQPKLIKDTPLPSAQEVDVYSEYIKALELEVFEREDRFVHLQSEIIEIAKELGIKPTLDIEKTVLSSENVVFKVSDYNMKWIEEYYVSLQKQQRDVKMEVQTLRERIGELWQILSEDIKTCNEFLQAHSGFSMDILHAWKMEFKRCDELKKANIEKFIKELRKELSALWEKCHFTNTQRNEFEYYHCSIFTEDLLTFHDIEIKKLEKYYECNKEIYKLLEKWQQSWHKVIDLEERASAPNRFKNRGGTLLKEEKERNLLKKRLPEYEDRLIELADNFQSQNGKPFLSWGETVAELISKAHDNYKCQKENKLSARKQQRDQNTVTPGKSIAGLGSIMSGSKLNLNAVRTPQLLSAQKRPPLTPLYSNSKRNKETPLPIPKIKLNNQTLKRRSRNSLERQTHLRKLRSKRAKGNKPPPNPTDTTDYDIFQREVSSKEACRSTLFDASSSGQLAVPLPNTPKLKKNVSSSTRTPTYNKKFRAMPGSSINI